IWARPVPALRQHLRRAGGLHLSRLHQERRLGEELVAAAVVEVPVRVGDPGHVGRGQAEPAELPEDVVTRLTVYAKALRALLAVAAEHVRLCLAVQPRVEEQAAVRGRDQEALDRPRPPRRRRVADHALAGQLQEPAAQGKDRDHRPASAAVTAKRSTRSPRHRSARASSPRTRRASTSPTTGASAKPCPEKPAATTSPSTPGTGPSTGRSSGVNSSRPAQPRASALRPVGGWTSRATSRLARTLLSRSVQRLAG